MGNLPPGVTESMIPGNRPEDDWYERFFEGIKVPSGLDYCDPYFVADRVTEFLTSLQKMSADSFKAGIDEGKIQYAAEEAERQESWKAPEKSDPEPSADDVQSPEWDGDPRHEQEQNYQGIV